MVKRLPNIDAILVGLGSIGKIHLSELLKRFETVLIIDPGVGVKDYISSLPNSQRIYCLNSTTEIRLSNTPILAVIANWGPDHFKSFNSLASIGISNFIVEKPLADSFQELTMMRNRVRENNLQIRANLQRSYSYLPDIFKELDKEFGIGDPIGIFVSGGAKCVATNGIHFLALASTLFGERPILTTAELDSQAINPRHSDFQFIEGVAIWKYSRQRFLTVNFLNRSQISAHCEIYFAHALAILTDDELVVSEIPQDSRIALSSATRTNHATKTIYKGNAFLFPDGSSGFERMYDSIFLSPSVSLNNLGFEVTEDLLGALLSGANHRSCGLPIQLSDTDSNFTKKWEIS